MGEQDFHQALPVIICLLLQVVVMEDRKLTTTIQIKTFLGPSLIQAFHQNQVEPGDNQLKLNHLMVEDNL